MRPRSEIKEYVNAAVHVRDESDGGRFPLTTIWVKIATDVIAVTIKRRMIETKSFVEFERVAVKTVDDWPFVNSSTAASNED